MRFVTLVLFSALATTSTVNAQILCFETDSKTGNETISSCVSGWCIKADFNGTIVKMCDDGDNTIDCWAFGNTCKHRELSDLQATYCCCDGNLCNQAFSSLKEGSMIVILIAMVSSHYG
ncbi:hypothetical protein L596_012942 [Steinernema carpocapsae]|uniref:Activin types I and II receptor domain-containing protein n=1 Tax=Steinernema carpocapsae TaxID=34508 RepID=A0A4U5NZK3_STECR|nr:hypothetical protein L596_012942 [Steinernema carpocapsae]